MARRRFETFVLPEALLPAVSMGCLGISRGSITVFLPLYALETRGVPGLWFGIFAVAVVAGRPIFVLLFDRKGRPFVIIRSHLLAQVGMLVLPTAHWGDTDVLPFPLENHWFYDAEDQVVKLLAGLDRQFDQWLTVYPVKFERCLSNVGHIGYRGVTQIDPFWNAYLRALVIEVGPNIEAARIPVERLRYSPIASSRIRRPTVFSTKTSAGETSNSMRTNSRGNSSTFSLRTLRISIREFIIIDWRTPLATSRQTGPFADASRRS